MKFSKYANLIFGCLVLAFAAFYFFQTTQMVVGGVKDAVVDAQFVPYVLSVLMFVLGGLQVVFGIRDSARFNEGAYVPEKSDYKTVVRILLLIVVYIALLVPVGFLFTTMAFLFLAFSILSPAGQKRKYVQYVIIALVTSTSLYFAFRSGLDLMLPQGILPF
ncbi:tripartite tricarboxylate transporter TctB family protein [Anaerotalea alkaliphila]|uniref:Tripartite tricarboxylate transporter TctB family protein n=1 Tax=Anaerotalea alkaliphila TaxID=2662126 RepID=A0A7X5HVG0_9FIRM|nr:tripartite tricarboxylate transporter TctB family protein [Anaerotalea alkaliphila]NDL67371.1 tripartite tricarboxylate transporter TctB family protein [Anaerotalea alkaliphila]